MLRVAIDGRLLAYQRAGTATYVRGLLGGLREFGRDEVHVVASRRDGERASLGTPRRDVWTPAHHPWERWALGIELATAPVDVLHSPDFIPPRRFRHRWARVITVHDFAFLRWPELVTPDARRYYGQIGRAVAEAERIIAVSEATRRDLIELVDPGAEAKTVVIPEGVDPIFHPIDRGMARRRVRERFGIDSPYFLFVGTIEPRKNLPLLFAAFRRLRERLGREAPRLVLAGARGWLDDGIEKAAASLGDGARFLGRVADKDLVALYNDAIGHVLVSTYEGFGLPPLEAMACGTPTLVAKAASLPEVVGDAGRYVDPEDVESIAEGLWQLWDDAALRRCLGERGRARAAAFTWERVAEQTSAAYAQAAACVS